MVRLISIEIFTEIIRVEKRNFDSSINSTKTEITEDDSQKNGNYNHLVLSYEQLHNPQER